MSGKASHASPTHRVSRKPPLTPTCQLFRTLPGSILLEWARWWGACDKIFDKQQCPPASTGCDLLRVCVFVRHSHGAKRNYPRAKDDCKLTQSRHAPGRVMSGKEIRNLLTARTLTGSGILFTFFGSFGSPHGSVSGFNQDHKYVISVTKRHRLIMTLRECLMRIYIV